jgi:hypothetical protein
LSTHTTYTSPFSVAAICLGVNDKFCAKLTIFSSCPKYNAKTDWTEIQNITKELNSINTIGIFTLNHLYLTIFDKGIPVILSIEYLFVSHCINHDKDLIDKESKLSIWHKHGYPLTQMYPIMQVNKLLQYFVDWLGAFLNLHTVNLMITCRKAK